MAISYTSRGIFLVISIILQCNLVHALTCGQSKCSDGEYCCSKERGGPKDCCCKDSPTGFSSHCEKSNSTSVGLPWYVVLIIVVAVLAVVGVAVFMIIRRRRQRYSNI